MQWQIVTLPGRRLPDFAAARLVRCSPSACRMRFPLSKESVVVVTGGSSGVGRAIALEFARKRVRLILASRDLTVLEDAANECRAHGATVITHALDMSDVVAVEELGQGAVGEFGRIDVWVNCAALLLFGRFEELPAADFRRVVEANLIGYANGCRAALKQFKAQGERGVLINMGSMLGVVGEPFVSAYVATKFAIRGLSACLRQECVDMPEIRVCTVLPGALDTPIYRSAGNYFGRTPRAIFPVYSPETAARIVVRLAERPRPEALVGTFAYALMLAARLAPRVLEGVVGRFAAGLQFKEEDAPPVPGNLFGSIHSGAVSGGWQEYWKRKLRLKVR